MKKICLEDIERLEGLVRRGQGQTVRKILLQLETSSISRDLRFSVANLARRNHLNSLALKVLNPIVYKNNQLNNSASDQEKAEYAVSLLDIGARSEAENLLSRLNLQVAPEALLYRSFLFFTQWDYHAAIPLLDEFVSRMENNSYQNLIGRVNLAAALIFDRRYQEAESLLAKLRLYTLKNEFFLLHGNCLELSAQASIKQSNFSQAEKYLNMAATFLSTNRGLGDFFVTKWKCVLALQRSPHSGSAIKQIIDLKRQALQREQWETLREADYYLGILTKDVDRLQKVYYGTPYKAYRDRLLEEAPKGWAPPSSYLYASPHSRKSLRRLDLATAEDSKGRSLLKSGFILHQTLQIFCQDFYAPIRLGALFSSLFPYEFFNPNSSPDRLHQILRRLRNFLERSPQSGRIVERDGAYRLTLNKGFAIELQKEQRKIDSSEVHLLKLEKVFSRHPFSRQQACTELNLSQSAFNRFTQKAESEGKIMRIGNGRSTRYLLKIS